MVRRVLLSRCGQKGPKGWTTLRKVSPWRASSNPPIQQNDLLTVGTHTSTSKPKAALGTHLPTHRSGADTCRQVGWIGRIPFPFVCLSMRNISTRGVKDTPRPQDLTYHSPNIATTATPGHSKVDRKIRGRQADHQLAGRLTAFPRRRAPHKPTRLPRTSKQRLR